MNYVCQLLNYNKKFMSQKLDIQNLFKPEYKKVIHQCQIDQVQKKCKYLYNITNKCSIYQRSSQQIWMNKQSQKSCVSLIKEKVIQNNHLKPNLIILSLSQNIQKQNYFHSNTSSSVGTIHQSCSKHNSIEMKNSCLKNEKDNINKANQDQQNSENMLQLSTEQKNELECHIDKFLSLKNGIHVMFIRHGETEGNIQGKIVGWNDSKLSKNGIKQVNAIAPFFREQIHRFDAVYSSDLSRAYDTARLLLGETKQSLIQIDKRLREINFGDRDGGPYRDLPIEEKQKLMSSEYKAPNGESWNEVLQRVNDFLMSLQIEGKYLVITHGAVIGQLLKQTDFLPDFDLILHNCSSVGTRVGHVNQQNKIQRLETVWRFPRSLS